MSSWRTAYASAVGISHATRGTPCQDACGCQVLISPGGSEILLAAVSDGAGSATRSEKGAHLAVRMFLSSFGSLVSEDPALVSINEGTLTTWLQELRAEIAALAETESCSSSEYACTFLAAIVGPERAVFMQIGDGAIVVAKDDNPHLEWSFWPQHGEFANSTSFVTQHDFQDALETAFVDEVVSEIAIFSDGIERLVLDFGARAVHGPALRPIFTWLAKTDPNVQEPGWSPGLMAFLNSERINRRTDDDKTLVMATRSAVPTKR